MSGSDLPPLAAIRAFEAAARHGSFTRASAELGMTQSAISYQIKVLEDRVGAALFVRRPRQVTLTETGRRLSQASTEALQSLAAAWAAARQGAQGTLVVSSVPTFAAQWFAQHLGSFQIAHPTLAVRLEASGRLVDFSTDDVDVGIRAGRGEWPGLVAHKLLTAAFTPMLSPKLVASIGGLAGPSDLAKLPIIGPTDVWWTRWLDAAGVPSDWLDTRQRSHLGAQAFEANAAMAGQGVALLTPAFYRLEVESGRLVQPFDLVCEDGSAYWLTYPEHARNKPKIRAFRDWILEAVPRSLATARDPS